MTKRKLDNARVIITGTSSGIGRALALELAKYNCRLVLTARRAERLEELKAEILNSNSALNDQSVQIVVGDIADDDVRMEVLQTAIIAFGGLDVLVNNAGVGAFGLFEDADPDRLLQILDVNLISSIEMTRIALPELFKSADAYKQTKTGCAPIISFTSSIMGKVGAPYSSEYSAAKCGLHGFTQALRAELKSKGVDVLTVSPGTTKTEFFDSVIDKTGMANWPSHKPVTPEYVAKRIVKSLKRGDHELVPYFWGEVLCILNRISPGFVDRVMSWYA